MQENNSKKVVTEKERQDFMRKMKAENEFLDVIVKNMKLNYERQVLSQELKQIYPVLKQAELQNIHMDLVNLLLQNREKKAEQLLDDLNDYFHMIIDSRPADPPAPQEKKEPEVVDGTNAPKDVVAEEGGKVINLPPDLSESLRTNSVSAVDDPSITAHYNKEEDHAEKGHQAD